MEVDDGYYTVNVPNYRIFIYRATTKFVLFIDSNSHGRKRMVGEKDAESFNQDLSVIFRKASGELGSQVVDTNYEVNVNDLRKSLDHFMINS